MHHHHPRHIYTRTVYTQHTFSIIIQCHEAQINRHSATKGMQMILSIFRIEMIIIYDTCALDSQIHDHPMKLAEEVVAFRPSNRGDYIWNWNENVAV